MVFYFGGFIKLVTFYILIEFQILFSEYVDLIDKLANLAIFWNKYLWTILEINLISLHGMSTWKPSLKITLLF